MNRKGEVATLFTIAALAVMAVGTFLGGQRAIQSTILKLGGFAYDRTYRAHFYTGPTFEEKDMVIENGVVNPNAGYILVRGSLCYTGATIPSQTGRFWVHTPKDPNIAYRGDPKSMVYEGKTVEYISSQVSRPYCDSPDVGKKNWRAWDFTLKLNKPFSKDLCQGLFVTASTSFVFKDPIEMDKNAWFDTLRRHGVDCSPTGAPSNTPTPVGPTTPPTITNNPSITVPPPTITRRPTSTPALRGCLQFCSQNPDNCQAGLTCKPYVCPPGVQCNDALRCQPDVPNDPRCPIITNTPTPTPAGCNQPCVRNEDCRPSLRCENRKCVPTNPIIKCPPVTITITQPPVTVPPVTIPVTFPPITQAPECRTDLQCGGFNNIPCPAGYDCIRARGNPGIIGLCRSRDPKCEQLTLGPTIRTTIARPQPARIRGDIVVNSCVKPTNVTTVICPKNDKNPNNCYEKAAPVTFVGQDPANPKKWLYKYEHTEAPISGLTRNEPIERGVLYENLQAFAQYAAAGLIHDSGIVTFPANQARTGARQAYAYILPTENEAVINYEVPQNDLVCPPTSVTPSLTQTPTPTTGPGPSNTPTPTAGICEYRAVATVIDADTGRPIPESQMGDKSKWGLANDKQQPKPYNVFSLYGNKLPNGERMSQYEYIVKSPNRFTFRTPPDNDPNALYAKGAKAYVNLYIDTDKWEIVSKNVCNGKNCPENPKEPVNASVRPLHQYGDGVTGFTIDCGTNVEYGWTVKKRAVPPQPVKACVMRDPENAVRCAPKNVEARRASTKTVAVRWDRPDDSCDFRVGQNGDHYRIDIVDLDVNNGKDVIKTCDNLLSTRAECKLPSDYQGEGGKPDFIRGHNYRVNVYAIKEIPGSSDLCASLNSGDNFVRPPKGQDDPQEPEPTNVPPIGGNDEIGQTRQLDWLNGDTGICWGAWSHGDCRHGYNGTDEWARSITDGRFDCLAPTNANHQVMVRLRTDSNTDNIVINPKRVDCRSCSPSARGVPSQCDSGPGANTVYGGEQRTIKKGQCYQVDESLGVIKYDNCPQTNAGQMSSQPGPGNPGGGNNPAPTSGPGPSNPIDQFSGWVTFNIADTYNVEDIIKVDVTYTPKDANGNGTADTKAVYDENGRLDYFEYTVSNADPDAPQYVITAKVEYKADGVIRRAQNTETFRRGAKDMNIEVVLQSADPVVTGKPDCSGTIANGSRLLCSVNNQACTDGQGGQVTSNYICNSTVNKVCCMLPKAQPSSKPAPKQKVVAVPASADSSLASNNVDKNFGTNKQLTIGQVGTTRPTSYFATVLRFDLRQYKGQTVKKAVLNLQVQTNQSNSAHPLTLFVSAYRSRWAENDITERNKPTYDAKINTRNVVVSPSTQTVQIELNTQTLQAWIDNNSINFGMEVAHDRTFNENNYIEVPSKEGATSTAPSLTLTLESSSTASPASNSTQQTTIAIQNSGNAAIQSVSIAACNSASKCTVNNTVVGLNAGGSTKFKPSFVIPADTLRLSCVVTLADGTRKQCTPQLVTQNSGNLQFNISTQPDGSVRTAVLSPLKNADTNGDCTVTAADGAGLRDLDGSGSINASDTSLFLSFIGQNACR